MHLLCCHRRNNNKTGKYFNILYHKSVSLSVPERSLCQMSAACQPWAPVFLFRIVWRGLASGWLISCSMD